MAVLNDKRKIQRAGAACWALTKTDSRSQRSFFRARPGKTGRDADTALTARQGARNLRQCGRPPRQTYIQDQIRRAGAACCAPTKTNLSGQNFVRNLRQRGRIPRGKAEVSEERTGCGIYTRLREFVASADPVRF